jgi:CBS domain containing-hemolysin-like protein
MTAFIYIFICLAAAGFFAGIETGLLSVNRMLLQEKCGKGKFYAKTAEYLLSKPERLLGTTLIGNNIATVTSAVIFNNFMHDIGYERLSWQGITGILGITLIFLIFNDIIPKSFFRQHADTISVKLSPILIVFYFLFLPAYLVLNLIVIIILYLTGNHGSRREEVKSKHDLRYLVNLVGKKLGLKTMDQRIIENIFDFREQIAREVMIPFHRLPVVYITNEIRDAVALSLESSSRFMPVSEKRADNMIGYIDIQDLTWKNHPHIKSAMKKAVYYPETKLIPDLLLDMNVKNLDVVFLSNEYGGVSGMITPEQIVGEVVQFITEESSSNTQMQIRKKGENHYIISGTADLEDVSNELGIGNFKKGYNSTLGGFLCEQTGEIPPLNSEYTLNGCIFKVIEKDSLHIKKVEVVKKV